MLHTVQILNLWLNMSGLNEFSKVLHSSGTGSLLSRELDTVRLKNIIESACRKKGIRADIQHATRIVFENVGLVIHTTTPTLANRLKQIQPTLERALFDAGIHAQIAGIRSSKINTIEKGDPYPLDPPRIAPAGAAQAVLAASTRAKDDDVKAALERLAKALIL